MSLDQRLLLLFYANVLHVRKKKESGSEPTRSPQYKRSFLLKHGAEEKWRAYQSKLVWCLRGRRTFFLPAERTPIVLLLLPPAHCGSYRLASQAGPHKRAA